MRKGQGDLAENTTHLSPACDFPNHVQQTTQHNVDCIPMQHKMVEHEETDDEQAEPDREGVCRAANLVQVAAMCNYCKRPMVPAKSAIRAEKPHSLSYHANTRTVRPPTTFVWSGAKMQDSVVWLKSMLTLASSS